MWRRIHGDKTQVINVACQQDGERSVSPSNTNTSGADDTAVKLKPANVNFDSPENKLNNGGAPISSPIINASTGVAAVDERPGLKVNGRNVLSIDEDSDWLSDMDCFVRRNIEVFPATSEDIELATNGDRKSIVTCGQVGFRCIHCAVHGARGAAVFYPLTIENIFDAVRNFQKHHFDKCPNMSKDTFDKYKGLSQCGSLTSVLRRYYILSAKAIGLSDSPDGIRLVSSPQRPQSATKRFIENTEPVDSTKKQKL